MRSRTVLAVLAAIAAVLLVPPLIGAAAGGGDGTQLRGLRVLVPNAPGGGYDITARTAARAMEESGTSGAVEVFNLPGAGGTVGLGRTVNESGNDRLVMSMGLGVVGAVFTNASPSTLADVTPIARLTEESEIVVVGKDSPFRSIEQLLAAWTADPGATPVGGGSSPGGPDHLAPMLMAQAVGLAPRDVNYVSYDGGGELLAAVLGDKVAFGVSGLGEFAEQVEAGEPADQRTVLILAGVLVATAAVIPVLGWPLAGMGLFWGATYALGSRSFPRDPLIAAGVSLTTWIVFDALLGVDLPGGPLMGVFS